MFGTGLNRYNNLYWDPWREFRRLQRDMNRMFGDFAGLTTREYPAVNLWTGDEDVVLTAEMPGVEASDLLPLKQIKSKPDSKREFYA